MRAFPPAAGRTILSGTRLRPRPSTSGGCSTDSRKIVLLLPGHLEQDPEADTFLGRGKPLPDGLGVLAPDDARPELEEGVPRGGRGRRHRRCPAARRARSCRSPWRRSFRFRPAELSRTPRSRSGRLRSWKLSGSAGSRAPKRYGLATTFFASRRSTSRERPEIRLRRAAAGTEPEDRGQYEINNSFIRHLCARQVILIDLHRGFKGPLRLIPAPIRHRMRNR